MSAPLIARLRAAVDGAIRAAGARDEALLSTGFRDAAYTEVANALDEVERALAFRPEAMHVRITVEDLAPLVDRLFDEIRRGEDRGWP